MFEFRCAHPETDETLYVEAGYEPYEAPSLYSPGQPERVEIIAAVNGQGEPVDFKPFCEWLEDRALAYVQAEADQAKIEGYIEGDEPDYGAQQIWLR